MDNIYAVRGSAVLVGINTNYGDTAEISNSYVQDQKICYVFKGNNAQQAPQLLMMCTKDAENPSCSIKNMKTEP